jgi:DNA-binding CsgD family transcriptional regulator
MHPLLRNYLDETEAAGNAEQLRLALSHFAAALELPTFAYIAIPSIAGRHLRLITNYAEPWRRHYVDQRYETCDPVVLHSIRQPRSFGWGREFGGNDPFCLRFFDEAASFGICYGYTIPLHHWHGRFAALTFATDREPLAFLQTTRRHALALEAIAGQFHRDVHYKLDSNSPIADIHFTCRERQCLTLAARGKTFGDIAVMLGISPRTVKDHINSAKRKLGARSAREAAFHFSALTRQN